MYSVKIKSIFEEFERVNNVTPTFILEAAADRIQGIKALIDIQYGIASYFAGLWERYGPHYGKSSTNLSLLLISLFHKNFFAFYSAYDQTIKGFYGPARPLLRYIFESLMISKYCNIADDVNLFERWSSGQTIYFTNSILKKIIFPDTNHFYDFWSLVCNYTHSTKYSLQISLEADENLEDILLNLTFLNVLLECSYHLLNTHLITSELEYLVKFYTSEYHVPTSKYLVPDLRKKAQKQFRMNRVFLAKDSIGLIYAYKRTWKIKEK